MIDKRNPASLPTEIRTLALCFTVLIPLPWPTLMSTRSPHPRSSRHPIAPALWVGFPVALVLLAGCANPLRDQRELSLRRSVREAAEREISEARAHPDIQTLTREPRVSTLRIDPNVVPQLEQMAGPSSYAGFRPPLGDSLLGAPQGTTQISLQRAVLSNVKRNLNVEFARLGPAISQQQLAAAEAAFDLVFFGQSTATRTDQPRVSQNFSSQVSDRRDAVDAQIGVRKSLISGGTLTIQHQFTRTDYRTPGLTVRPNPVSENNIVLQFDQPLLRNFGSDASQAQIRLARNTELDNIQQLKATLLQNITDTETAYWNLVRAQANLKIAQRLLDRGEEVLRVLRQRIGFDAKPATISNAAAAVENRRTDVLRAQRLVRDTSDRLKVLMNDPELTIGGETLLDPSDSAVDQPIQFSLIDSLNTAIAARPEVQRAVISLDSASIRQGFADNQRLPRLDLRALTRISSLGDSIGQGYDALAEADFVDYQVGVFFEQAVGNRAAEATYSGRRLERLQAVLVYRSVVQQVVQDLKNALRDVQTNYQLIEQTRAARLAATEDLRTLQVEEETLQGLTPEFLNLKLQRQQALAVAEQSEIQATTDYTTSIARLYSATGTALERNRITFEVPNVADDTRTTDLLPDVPSERQRDQTDAIRSLQLPSQAPSPPAEPSPRTASSQPEPTRPQPTESASPRPERPIRSLRVAPESSPKPETP